MGMVPQSLGCSSTWAPRTQETPLEGYRSTLRDSIQRLDHDDNTVMDHREMALVFEHLTKRQAYLEYEAVWGVLRTSAPHLSENIQADLQRRILEATFLGCDIRYS